MPKPKQPAKPKAGKCLWCDGSSHSRGLCSSCYRAAAREAAGNPKKWMEMEAANLVLPSKRKSNGFMARLAAVRSQTK